MEKKIKKLITKDTLSGDDVGRIMILDLLSAYENMNKIGDGNGVLTDEQKIKLVNNLSDSSDISRYNDFKGVHDYLTNTTAVFDSFTKAFEICYWKAYYLLIEMKRSETETLFSKSRPLIMTELQYDKFKSEGNATPACGISVLRDIPECFNQNQFGYIDENGFYVENEPVWRKPFTAENIISEYSYSVTESFNGMKTALAECFARQKALELIGRFIKVPDVKILITPISDVRIEIFNIFMKNIINSIQRDDGEENLKMELHALFTPLDCSIFIPDAKAVTKARRALNFDMIKNNSEAFVSMLKREWQNDSAR